MSIKKKFWHQVDNGLKGLNRGIPIPLEKLSNFMSNIQQGTYYLLSGSTGSGKSTIANECFMNYPLQWLQLNPDRQEKYHIEYFNLEIQDVDVSAKLRANWIFRQTKAKLKLHVDKIFQKGNYFLTREEIEWLKKSDDFMDFMEDNVNFIAGEEVSIAFVYKRLWECAKKFGRMEVGADGKPQLHTFEQIDPNQYVVFLFDNVNNLNDKALIDTLSSYFVKFRKSCNFSFVVIQQYNRAQEGEKRTFMEPQLSDLKETSRTADDCNIALLTYTPGRLGLTEYQGYNLEEPFGNYKLGDLIRFLKIAKNRNGRDNVYVPYLFNGAYGYVKEMPHPDVWRRNENNVKEQFIKLFAT
ncbi:MAG TPA: hypothetical protein VIK77_02670 [Tissierellaceae bacterium]